jgi:2-desacetyl-2-hydroxyethyl bacteriochlorophyllide A dehydrogenase
MKGVVIQHAGKVGVCEIQEPRARPGEVVVEVGASGICGSDIRYVHGDNPWSSQTLGRIVPSPPNMVLGHEFAGTVVSVGEGVPAARVGERVGVLAYRACHRCHYCRTGRHNLCEDVQHIGHATDWDPDEPNPAGMAQRCRVWDEMAVDLPGDVSFEVACFLDPLAVAIHACDRAFVGRNDRIATIGTGVVGLLIVQVAQLLGASPPLCVDTYARPLETARLLGAADTVELAGEDDATTPLMEHAESMDIVFDTVGNRETIRSGLAMLRRGGRLVLLALGTETVDIQTSWLSGERSVTTSANNAYPDFHAAIDMLAAGRVQCAPLITHTFDMAQATEALNVAEHKEQHGAVKVILYPNR